MYLHNPPLILDLHLHWETFANTHAVARPMIRNCNRNKTFIYVTATSTIQFCSYDDLSSIQCLEGCIPPHTLRPLYPSWSSCQSRKRLVGTLHPRPPHRCLIFHHYHQAGLQGAAQVGIEGDTWRQCTGLEEIWWNCCCSTLQCISGLDSCQKAGILEWAPTHEDAPYKLGDEKDYWMEGWLTESSKI